MVLLALLCVMLASPSHSLAGYQFEDNKSDKRSLPENGELSYELPSIPSHLAICFSLYISYNRYSSLVPIMDFRTSYGAEYLEFLYGRDLVTLF